MYSGYSCKRFLAVTICTVAAGISIAAGINAYIDLYGVFRSHPGEGRKILGDERFCKYLYAFRYIPENFNGLLFGSSGAENLPMNAIPEYRIYNCAINGGNSTELRQFAEEALRHRQYEIVIVMAYRYMTKDHGFKTDLMSPRSYWSALGSTELVGGYTAYLLDRFGFQRTSYTEFGTMTHEPADAGGRKQIEQVVYAIQNRLPNEEVYDIDPIGLENYESLLRVARSRSRRLVVYFPPIAQPILDLVEPRFRGYQTRIRGLLRSTDMVIDFNTAEFAALRRDPSNYKDYSHLSKKGADILMRELRVRIMPGASGTAAR